MAKKEDRNEALDMEMIIKGSDLRVERKVGHNNPIQEVVGDRKMNPKLYTFDALILPVPGIDGAYIEFPYDVRAEFGKGRVSVHATFDGEPYGGQLVRMKTPGHIIGLRKDLRAKIRKAPGDTVHVTIIEQDKEKL